MPPEDLTPDPGLAFARQNDKVEERLQAEP
jgi:hypothetical protein